ncbi:MAG: hypothetical protein JJT76_00110 [Clostridiaceae bacterium]|nr:hypothetical protein [Clostridiaceae bacterium]
MIKKVTRIVIISYVSLMLIGCVNVNYYINVDENEFVEVKLIAEIEKVMDIEEVERYIEENFYLHLKSNSFKEYHYELYEDDEYIIFEMYSTFPEETKLGIINFWEFNISGSSSVSSKTLPFYTRQSFNAIMTIPEDSREGYVNQNYLKDDVEVKVSLTLPFSVKEHNADFLSNNGETLVWNVDPFKENNIKFEYVKRNLHEVIAFIVIVGVSIFFIKKRHKR